MSDIMLRLARETAAMNAERCDGCRMHTELYRSYWMREKADPKAVMAKPLRIIARFESFCRSCDARIRIDDLCVWQAGESGVLCLKCDAKPPKR